MVTTRKLIFGTLFGMAGGLSYAALAWGLNAVMLSRSHFPHAWVVVLAGLPLALLVGGVAGYLAMRLDKAIVGGLIWMASGLLLAVAGTWLPLWLFPQALPRLEPVLAGWIKFGWLDGYTAMTYLCMFVSGVIFTLVGVLEVVLVEKAAYSPYDGALLIPMVICAMMTGLAGGVVDNMANSNMREYPANMEILLNFALENKGVKIDPKLARQMHMNAISAVMEDISVERKVYYYSFEESGEQGRLLVNFEGRWVLCDMFAAQPSYCRRVDPPK